MLSQVNENLVNNIYNFRPAFNNVFEVYFIKTGLQREIDSKFSNVTAFTCSNVKFNGEDIDIKRHDVTKFFYVKDFKRQDQLELTFIETRDRIVRKWATAFCDCPFKKLHLIYEPIISTACIYASEPRAHVTVSFLPLTRTLQLLTFLIKSSFSSISP